MEDDVCQVQRCCCEAVEVVKRSSNSIASDLTKTVLRVSRIKSECQPDLDICSAVFRIVVEV